MMILKRTHFIPLGVVFLFVCLPFLFSGWKTTCSGDGGMAVDRFTATGALLNAVQLSQISYSKNSMIVQNRLFRLISFLFLMTQLFASVMR